MKFQITATESGSDIVFEKLDFDPSGPSFVSDWSRTVPRERFSMTKLEGETVLILTDNSNNFLQVSDSELVDNAGDPYPVADLYDDIQTIIDGMSSGGGGITALSKTFGEIQALAGTNGLIYGQEYIVTGVTINNETGITLKGKNSGGTDFLLIPFFEPGSAGTHGKPIHVFINDSGCYTTKGITTRSWAEFKTLVTSAVSGMGPTEGGDYLIEDFPAPGGIGTIPVYLPNYNWTNQFFATHIGASGFSAIFACDFYDTEAVTIVSGGPGLLEYSEDDLKAIITAGKLVKNTKYKCILNAGIARNAGDWLILTPLDEANFLTTAEYCNLTAAESTTVRCTFDGAAGMRWLQCDRDRAWPIIITNGTPAYNESSGVVDITGKENYGKFNLESTGSLADPLVRDIQGGFAGQEIDLIYKICAGARTMNVADGGGNILFDNQFVFGPANLAPTTYASISFRKLGSGDWVCIRFQAI